MITPRSDFRQAVGRVAARWWRGLDDDRGTRASLRRAGCITDVFGVPDFHHDLLRPLELLLNRQLTDSEAEWCAVVAAVLAHVEKSAPGSTPAALGRYFGSSRKGTHARISGLRFRRILAVEEPDSLMRTMIRVVRLMDKTCPIIALAAALTGWPNEVTRRAIAMEYYAAAPTDEK